MSRRIRKLGVFHEFLLSLRARIRFSAQSLAEIFCEDGNSFATTVVPYLKTQTLPQAYASACEAYFPHGADRELALHFLRDFGRSDLENQLRHLDATCALVQRAEEEARSAFQSGTRVTMAFYAFLGAVSAILLV